MGFLFINLIIGLYSSGIIGKPFTKSLTSLFSLNIFLTIRSSNEWKVITHNLPPGFNISIASLIEDDNTFNSSSKSNSNEVRKQTETNTLTSKGNIGVTSSAELLEKWRKVIINIDELIINECSDLFMQVY